MHIVENDRIVIISTYDIINKRTEGKIYSKVEAKEEILVAKIIEKPKGTAKLNILKEYRGKSYIKEDFEELKPEFISYANMWNLRESRGVC